MIKSMTGFGRCEISEGERKITVEMKSVNHRYLDVNIKMPKKLNFFDSKEYRLLKNGSHFSALNNCHRNQKQNHQGRLCMKN